MTGHPATLTAEDVDTTETLRRMLRGHLHVTPGRTDIRAYRAGRYFVVLSADRWWNTPWPTDATDVLDPLSGDLAELRLWRGRQRSVYSATDLLHAPVRCAPQLLAALLAADRGDLHPVRLAAEAVAPVVAELEATTGKANKAAFARTAVTAVEDRVIAAFSSPAHRAATGQPA